MDEIKVNILSNSKKKNYKPWVMFLVLLPVVVILGYLYMNWSGVENNLSSQALSEKTDLSRKPQINPLQIISQKAIAKEEMPESLAKFLPNGAKNIKIYATEFPDQNTGISFSYALEDMALLDIFSAQRNIANFNKWLTLNGARAEQYAFLDLKNPSFEFKIQFALTKDGIIQVEGNASQIAK